MGPAGKASNLSPARAGRDTLAAVSPSRLLPCLAAAVLVAACSGFAGKPAPRAHPSDRCGGEPCIQVGTFNAYWLGSNRRYQQPLRTRAEVRRLAAFVTDELDLEVIALQELNTAVKLREKGERVHVKRSYRWLRRALARRGYRLATGTSGGAQRLAIAYDTAAVELLEPARELEVRDAFDFGEDCRRDGLRRPLAARLRAGDFDFWVVGVHLKSKRDGECADRMRAEQARDLVAAIDELSRLSGEPDVILAGDFNAELSDPSIAELFAGGRFRALTADERRAPDSGRISYLVPRYASLIDHLMIREATEARWVGGSTVVYAPGGESETEGYLRQLSDHAPVWGSFLTALDDG